MKMALGCGQVLAKGRRVVYEVELTNQNKDAITTRTQSFWPIKDEA